MDNTGDSGKAVDRFDPQPHLRIMIVPGHPRISIDPAVLAGKPAVVGTRMAVHEVVGQLSAGTTEDELLEDFPYITRDDIRACLAYASEMVIEVR